MSAAWPVGPGRPAAPAAEVHVWRAELDAIAPGGAAGLAPAERERAARMRRPGAARAWIGARLALRAVLSRYLDEEPAAIALRAGAHGKPALAEAPGRLEFNLSHSGSLALIAAAVGQEVGVDLERIDSDRDFPALAERGLEPAAAAAVRASAPDEQAATFYAAWTRREALHKCRGGGLGGPVPSGPVALLPLEVGPGYAAALAVAGAGAPLVRRFSLEGG